MLKCKIVGLVLAAVFGTVTNIPHFTVPNFYEEDVTYRSNPTCKPSTLDQGVTCTKASADPITVQGGLYANWELHYVPLASAYYVARMADALGYQKCCPTDTDFLKTLDIMTPWSGTHGAIAIDGSCGYDKLLLRRCQFPNPPYPFLCTGSRGNPGTYGRRLETLSYNSVLQGSNNKWVLFTHCWYPDTPSNDDDPKEKPTSFNVFNLEPELPAGDRDLIIAELNRRGFNTDPSNIIEFDYTNTTCTPCNNS